MDGRGATAAGVEPHVGTARDAGQLSSRSEEDSAVQASRFPATPHENAPIAPHAGRHLGPEDGVRRSTTLTAYAGRASARPLVFRDVLKWRLPRASRPAAQFVELFADDSQLVRGLKSAERRLKAFGAGVRSIGTQLLGVGAGIAAPLVATTNVFAQMGDQLGKMSARTGIGVEALSELGYAAEQSGADLGAFENGVRRMQRFVFEAAKGTQLAVETLSRLGLTLSDLNGLSPEQQFERIADRLSKIEDPTKRTALAMEVFGKSGTSLLPLMQDGAERHRGAAGAGAAIWAW